jgi:hypothetical protein
MTCGNSVPGETREQSPGRHQAHAKHTSAFERVKAGTGTRHTIHQAQGTPLYRGARCAWEAGLPGA